MTDADKPAFVSALAELKTLKPGPAITDLQFAAWWNAMREKWTLAAFRTACARLRDECEFMPNPFHFEQLRKALLETCGEAWSRAKEHARSLTVSGGFIQERSSGDPLLDRVARVIGGYSAIARADTREMPFLEKRFCEHFESIADANDVRVALPDLAAPRRDQVSGPLAAKLLGVAK